MLHLVGSLLQRETSWKASLPREGSKPVCSICIGARDARSAGTGQHSEDLDHGDTQYLHMHAV